MKTGLSTVQWIEITYVANNINSSQKVSQACIISKSQEVSAIL